MGFKFISSHVEGMGSRLVAGLFPPSQRLMVIEETWACMSHVKWGAGWGKRAAFLKLDFRRRRPAILIQGHVL